MRMADFFFWGGGGGGGGGGVNRIFFLFYLTFGSSVLVPTRASRIGTKKKKETNPALPQPFGVT
jgi:hypothetical protein